jgi:hypothetical protein
LACIGGLDTEVQDGGKAKKVSTLMKFLRFHQRLQAYLIGQEEDFVTASGWKRVTNVSTQEPELVSLYGGSAFSMNDTEHILCKVWLCIMSSHSSRNVSAEKSTFATHCHPLPAPQDWEPLMAPCMKKIWDSYLKTAMLIHPPSKVGGIPKRKYRHPSVMLFKFERMGGEGERIEKILRQLAANEFGTGRAEQ